MAWSESLMQKTTQLYFSYASPSLDLKEEASSLPKKLKKWDKYLIKIRKKKETEWMSIWKLNKVLKYCKRIQIKHIKGKKKKYWHVK